MKQKNLNHIFFEYFSKIGIIVFLVVPTGKVISEQLNHSFLFSATSFTAFFILFKSGFLFELIGVPLLIHKLRIYSFNLFTKKFVYLYFDINISLDLFRKKELSF